MCALYFKTTVEKPKLLLIKDYRFIVVLLHNDDFFIFC